MEKYNEKDGVWRTIGGRRVFIKKGQSMSDAMKESGKFKSASKTKADTSNNVKEETIKKDELDDKQKVVDSRKSDYDASSKLDKTDATKLKMGWGMSDDAVKGYAREQAHGINDKNVNNILSQLNDEGSDFTFGDARIEDGKIKTDVSVFMPDERGMVNRELEIPINKEDSNIHSIEAKIRDWQSRHSSPDTFYDKDFSESGEKETSKKERTYEDVDKEWKEQASKMEKNYDEFGGNTAEDEKRLNELSAERDKLSINRDDSKVDVPGFEGYEYDKNTGEVKVKDYDKKLEEVQKNESKSSFERPVAKPIETQGTSNRKEVSNNIQAHILDYYDSPEDFVQQMEAMHEPTMWKAGEKIAQGGSYLIYNGDMADFLNDLKINPKGKTFDDEKAFNMYTSLIGRESAKLYDKIKKSQGDRSTNDIMNDAIRVKASRDSRFDKRFDKDLENKIRTDYSDKTKIDFGKADHYGNGRKSNKQEVEMSLKNGNFSASGDIWNNRGTDIIAGGQMIDEIKPTKNQSDYKKVKDMWQKHHLNDMKAGTEKQENALKEYASEKDSIRKEFEDAERQKYPTLYRDSSPYVSGYQVDKELLKRHNLDVDDGYEYGTGWLKREIPSEDLKTIVDLMDKNNNNPKKESMIDSLRRKAFEKYLKEHPASKMKYQEYLKNIEK